MDWIKMRVGLSRDPKTIKLKKALANDPAFQASLYGPIPSIALAKFIVACLIDVWGMANEHIEGEDDLCRDMELDDLDDVVGGVPGFGRSMAVGGWAIAVEDGIVFPNFREFNTPERERYSPKSGAERQQEYRDRIKRDENVTKRDDGVTKKRNARDEKVTASDNGVTRSDGELNRREEKRREGNTGRPPSSFVRPTIDEIKSYCLERKNSVDAQRFLDHYQSNGWKVGKNAMKDWKAAVRTWEKNDFGDGNGKPPATPYQSPPDVELFIGK